MGVRAAMTRLPTAGGTSSAPLQPSAFGQHEALTFENRLFTLCNREGDTSVSVPFSDHLDPLGDLQKVSLEGLKHLEENVVRYLRRVEEDDKIKFALFFFFFFTQSLIHLIFRFIDWAPERFRLGDIVEVQFSIVEFSKKGRKEFVPRLALRTITLIDDKICDVCVCLYVLSSRAYPFLFFLILRLPSFVCGSP